MKVLKIILCFSVVVCVLLSSVVVSSANNSVVIDDIYDAYPFFDLNCSLISLTSDNLLYGSSPDSLRITYIDNIFSSQYLSRQEYDPYDSVDYIVGTDSNNTGSMNSSEYHFVNTSSVSYDSLLVQGVRGKLTPQASSNNAMGYNFDGLSVYSHFESPALKQFTYSSSNQLNSNNYVSVSFLIPTIMYENIRDDFGRSAYSLEFHFNAEVARFPDEGVRWDDVEYVSTFGTLKGGNNQGLINNISTSVDLYLDDSNVDTLPLGFSLCSVRVPLGDFLATLCEVSNESTIFYKNLSFYPTFEINLDYFDGITIATRDRFGDDSYLPMYYYKQLVLTNEVAVLSDSTRKLPIFSVYSRANQVDFDPVQQDLESFISYIDEFEVIVRPIDPNTEFDFVTWIGNTLFGIFQVELIPGISIASILYVVIGLGVLFFIIKYFAGG